MKRSVTSLIGYYYSPESQSRFRKLENGQFVEPQLFTLIEDMTNVILAQLNPVEQVMLALTCKAGLVRFKKAVQMLRGNNLFQAVMMLEDSILFRHLFEERLYYSMGKGVTYSLSEYKMNFSRQLAHMFGTALTLETIDGIEFLKTILQNHVIDNPLCHCTGQILDEDDEDGDDGDHYDEEEEFTPPCMPSWGSLFKQTLDLGYYPTSIECFSKFRYKYLVSNFDYFYNFQLHNIRTRRFALFHHALEDFEHYHEHRYDTYNAIERFAYDIKNSSDPSDMVALRNAQSIFTEVCSVLPLFYDHHDFVAKRVCPLKYHLAHYRPYPQWDVSLDTNAVPPLILLTAALHHMNFMLMEEIINYYDITMSKAELLELRLEESREQASLPFQPKEGWLLFYDLVSAYETNKRPGKV